jgi:hypothetical protein
VPPLLIVGVPRSGTTWTGRVLGRTDGAQYVNEPDGFRDPYAFRIMLARGENPILAATDSAPDYERLWRGALGGGVVSRHPGDRIARLLYERTPLDARRDARATGRVPARLRLSAALARPRVAAHEGSRVVVKSVQSVLAIEWIAARFAPRVLVVERNPLNVLASWSELGYVRNDRERDAIARYARRRWGSAPPQTDASQLAHQSFVYGVLAAALREATAGHPEWIVARHEDLCTEPTAQFRALAGRCGLVWGPEAEQYLADTDQDGTPYRTLRRTAEQPDRWRERLDAEQVATIHETLTRLPLAARGG